MMRRTCKVRKPFTVCPLRKLPEKSGQKKARKNLTVSHSIFLLPQEIKSILKAEVRKKGGLSFSVMSYLAVFRL